MTREAGSPADVVIACSLTAGQYASRTKAMSALAERALVHREATPHGERLTFDDADDVRQDLEAILAAESACCPFLAFELSRDEGYLVLRISGPEAVRPLIAELFVLTRLRSTLD